MSVPAKRRSSSKGRRGRAHLALKPKRKLACSNCGKPILPHRACPYCGYYKGRAVITFKTKTKKNKK